VRAAFASGQTGCEQGQPQKNLEECQAKSKYRRHANERWAIVRLRLNSS